MRWWLCVGVSALAGAASLINGVPAARSEVVDMGKYPDIAGGWGRSEMFQWGRGEKPPLTPEYQAVLDANRADRATGGHGTDVMYRCLPPGMPRQMHAYAPMEIVITPKTTYVLIDHIQRAATEGVDVSSSKPWLPFGKWATRRDHTLEHLQPPSPTRLPVKNRQPPGAKLRRISRWSWPSARGDGFARAQPIYRGSWAAGQALER